LRVVNALAYARLVAKVTKENLWLYIIRMLLNRPMYAYEISKALQDSFGFSTATITVYAVLYKMQREGFVRLNEEKTVSIRPDRKYYKVTEEGRDAFMKGKGFLEDTLKKLYSE
jgi:DNA-binding PadR family transcriptional regulator